ncbi:hypothetical protein DCS_02519 [Drechmeria coniospora]|uniref:Uncharacterized protein n=1 Tax=Drechmeria coniospora TaxID=98403 RepID=A0A151GW86_DRECN|nr:hypothetical protein DCS_02519 [Drechmeria coniospora]KYK61377.1 hypothetical protein DCS_02519 [Drechmeria coniospora]
MPQLALSVTLLLQAYAVSSSVIDPATLVARDDGAFQIPTTCPTDREEFVRHRDKYKVEALNKIVYGCVPSLKPYVKPDDGSKENQVVARGDSNSIEEEPPTQNQQCIDAVKAWGCVHGLDCRFEQKCLKGFQRSKKGKSGFEIGNCAGQTQEMHCKISTNEAAAQEVEFDQVASWIIMAKEESTSGKIYIEFGRDNYDFVLFNGVVDKDVAGVPMNIPEMFGGNTTFSPRQLTGLDVRFIYSQLLQGSMYGSTVGRKDTFQIKSTNLIFEVTPIIDYKIEAWRRHTIIWTGNVNHEGWSADTGEQESSPFFDCLRTKNSECWQKQRYG